MERVHIQEDLRKRNTILWTEATNYEFLDKYSWSENNGDDKNEDTSDFVVEVESAMEMEQLPPSQAGIYEVEIGSDDDDCPEKSSLVDKSVEFYQFNVYVFKWQYWPEF